jgi:DNA-binding NarL/FixJ family response regulator
MMPTPSPTPSSSPAPTTPSAASDLSLSARERQIVAAVARGLSNRDIALEAGIAPQTVKNHLSSIFHKLQVRSRLQLAILALQQGLDSPPN